MSDCITKIIPGNPYPGNPYPGNPYSHIAPQLLQKVEKYLVVKIVAEEITSVVYNTPAFVDCGKNLEEIKCPFCGAALDSDWWGDVMDKAAENDFVDLTVTTPCCHKGSSLNDLEYHFPCGFACVEIDIYNPTSEVDDDCLKALQELLGGPIRIIYSHI